MKELKVEILEAGSWTRQLSGTDIRAVDLSAYFGTLVGVNCGIFDTLTPQTKRTVLTRANCIGITLATIRSMVSAVGYRSISRPVLRVKFGHCTQGLGITVYNKGEDNITYITLDFHEHKNYFHFFSTLVHELTHFLEGFEHKGYHENTFYSLGLALLAILQKNLNLDSFGISVTDIANCPITEF